MIAPWRCRSCACLPATGAGLTLDDPDRAGRRWETPAPVTSQRSDHRRQARPTSTSPGRKSGSRDATQNDRMARSRICLARAENIQPLLTFDFWDDPTLRSFGPAWDEILRSLRVAEPIIDPSLRPAQPRLSRPRLDASSHPRSVNDPDVIHDRRSLVPAPTSHRRWHSGAETVPVIAFGLALVWLVRARGYPWCSMPGQHLDSDLAVDGLTLLDVRCMASCSGITRGRRSWGSRPCSSRSRRRWRSGSGRDRW